MVKASLSGNLGAGEVYCCEEPGCDVHYDSSIGYFYLVRGEVVVDTFQRYCRRDGSPMYLAGFNGEPGSEVWCCGQTGCRQQEMVDQEAETVPSNESMGE